MTSPNIVRNLPWARLLLCLALSTAAQVTLAHGFGQRFDLPVPLWLWVTGAGLTVLLSFGVVIDFLPPEWERTQYPVFAVWQQRRGRSTQIVIAAVRLVAVGMLVVTVLAGLFGNPDPDRNLAPTMIWIIWWVGIAFASALLGNIWHVLNPLRTVGLVVASLRRRTGARFTPTAFPRWLGMWPAVLLFWLFAWGEHVWAGASVPYLLACCVLAYAAITWTGMALFGVDAWTRNGDCFAIVFRFLGHFAPIDIGASGVALRPPAVGLLDERPVPVATTVFLVVLLAGVTFDGFVETPLWLAIASWLGGSSPALTGALLLTLAWAVFPLLFLGLFTASCWGMRSVMSRAEAGRRVRTWDLAGHFVLTLLPIAVAYHLAHYLTLLLTSGQSGIALASDPFGYGWDLFGTADYTAKLDLIGVKALWNVVVATILVGHLLSVYLAHLVALETCGDRRLAVRSQIPMLILMVAYTMTSLWIMAQPAYG